jgi:VIT1/CCC1 family predicted Fe2+/Mn2+ transporter
MAVAVGGVGVTVLALSVWHCTEAISLLTGSPLLLAVLLAIGIDCGMVGTEMAAIMAAHDTEPNCRRWANAYIVASVLLSMLLNSVASGLHASRFQMLAYGVGAIIPVLVFILGKVAGLLWEE